MKTKIKGSVIDYNSIGIDAINGYAIKYNTLDITAIKSSQLDRYTNMLYVTYNELVKLRDNEDLIPGQQYRIVGYQGTDGFDIIVTADSESTLNENARATWREGDVTFKNCDLNA